jgi:hypothetical protein
MLDEFFDVFDTQAIASPKFRAGPTMNEEKRGEPPLDFSVRRAGKARELRWERYAIVSDCRPQTP